MSRSNKTAPDVIFYFLVIPLLGATFGFDALVCQSIFP